MRDVRWNREDAFGDSDVMSRRVLEVCGKRVRFP